MATQTFGEIRNAAVELWTKSLNRTRQEGDLTDDYSASLLCTWQSDCGKACNKHCSFYCSLGDWLNNISDILYDERWDNLSDEDHEVIFRFYTKIMLLVSEVVEDFLHLHRRVNNTKEKSDASRDFEKGAFAADETRNLSNFINSVGKHKTERNNLHVCNHHLTTEFEDFGAKPTANQIRLDQLQWDAADQNTTILMPRLNYFIEVIARMHDRLHELLQDPTYSKRVYDLYADKFGDQDDEDGPEVIIYEEDPTEPAA
ncbi:hypothetical protein EGT74_06355 [Chitinophaga lutea]|uniref:Uncharacterized protein n=1 Tax=Chitinophaga lutea TaxID=2488634 RepID=A0A3N4Q1S1_9BACT|nr:hypothetical protein [Chitinophaga lutea]RPE13149.1 hypothetical protein EGT74_06355 [Chitinophaga lutea]